MQEESAQQKIGLICEFDNRNLELEYYTYEIGKAIKYIKPIVLILGFLNTLFAIPDWFLIKNAEALKVALISRAVFLILVVIFFYRINKIKDPGRLAIWISIYEVAGLLDFLLIFYQYESPNFLIQAFGVMIIIQVVFLVPNRWIYMILVSVITGAGFLILSVCYLQQIESSELAAGAVYISVVILLSSISSHRINYHKRIQYVNNQKLVLLSTTDPLTKVYNRAKLYEELHYWIGSSKKDNSPLSLVLLDFDDFKKINDNYGHLYGDNVMLAVSGLVKSMIRDRDVFARWGGEEFILLLPHTKKDQTIQLTEQIRAAISNQRFDKVKQVTCSFGVVSLEYPDDNAEALIHRADELLYSAKRSGKNTVRY